MGRGERCREICASLLDQPFGILPLPAGYLLWDLAPGDAEDALSLKKGQLPKSYSSANRVIQMALDSLSVDEICSELSGDDLLMRYNRLVLTGDKQVFDELAGQVWCDLDVLIKFQGFLRGFCPLPNCEAALDPVIRSVLYSAQAALEAESGRNQSAVVLLEKAIDLALERSPILAAGFMMDAAQFAALSDDTGEVAKGWLERALAILSGSDFTYLLAEVHLNLAIMSHERVSRGGEACTDTAGHYLEASRLVDPLGFPLIYGNAQMNLALLYLAVPMVEASDKLRYAVAVSCLRQAVQTFESAQLWQEYGAARMNLANALIYAPSSKVGDNLVEAVEIYEDVAKRRAEVGDAVGYARVCANQGNALAHLGIYDHAKERLHEARSIFEEFSMLSEVMAVRGVLDEIERRRVGARSTGT